MSCWSWQEKSLLRSMRYWTLCCAFQKKISRVWFVWFFVAMVEHSAPGDFFVGSEISKHAARFDALCAASPNTPEMAIRAFSVAYTVLVSTFFDERFTPPDDLEAVEVLMGVREEKGYVVGLVFGAASGEGVTGKAARSIMARRGADALHIENRACKAEVFTWLDANFSNCKSMDAAAEAIVGKIVPQKFRTVRSWVAEWKKLRSASTP